MPLFGFLIRCLSVCLSALIWAILGGCTGADTAKAMCTFDEAIETDGYRRLALIVGVGEYKNEDIPDLAGPPNDAGRFYDLLTRQNGYGFLKENVCMLLDEGATTARASTQPPMFLLIRNEFIRSLAVDQEMQRRR